MLIFVPVIFVVAVVLVVRGMRGRVVGDDPHCRKCGFNLRGRDPSSKRCPECGTELTDAAIRIGVRERRRVPLVIGSILLVLSLGVMGVGGWELASEYDWNRVKPTSWLIKELDSATPATVYAARGELQRRIEMGSVSQARIDALIDHILNRQADRSKAFPGVIGDLVLCALKANRMDKPRTERFFKQGASAKLTLKPKIRRGQNLSVDLDIAFDRYATNPSFVGKWSVAPLMLDDVVMLEKWAQGPQKEEQLAGSIGYGSGIGQWNVGALADGKHTARSKLTATLTLTQPASTGPVTFELPLETTIELLPKGAIVDEFKVDPELREEMRKALVAARVTHNERGQVKALLKVDTLPMPLSAKVVLTQAGKEHVIGGVRLDATQPMRWQEVYNWQKPKFSGTVDVHLRPDQEPADGTHDLATYWGEEIVIPGVQVDAPYVPPFNNDESLRPAVLKAVRTPQLTRTKDGLSANLSVAESPVKLAYLVVVSRDGREVVLNNHFSIPAKQNHGHATSCADIDPAHQATECDVIFRPDPDWEASSSDLVPPWGGEIVFRNVKIGPAK